MEKLIELLNEYEAKRHKTSVIANIRKGEEDRLSYLEMNWNYSELLCISKGYGFIERLVKNDKIEYQTFGNAFGTKYLESPVGSGNHEKISDYLDIIKLLAVSDTPIEDLVSYLKE